MTSNDAIEFARVVPDSQRRGAVARGASLALGSHGMNWYLATVLALGITGLVLAYAAHGRAPKRAGEKRSWLHYVLLWPLVLDADRDNRNGHFLTAREWAGWVLVGVIIVLAVAFT